MPPWSGGLGAIAPVARLTPALAVTQRHLRPSLPALYS